MNHGHLLLLLLQVTLLLLFLEGVPADAQEVRAMCTRGRPPAFLQEEPLNLTVAVLQTHPGLAEIRVWLEKATHCIPGDLNNKM